MSETTKDWVLPNGFTYIASTAGFYGSWAKATDPVTAARNAVRDNGNKYPDFVSVWYGPDETTYINQMGGLQYHADTADKMVPIGFFEVRKNSVSPSNDERYTHSQFMDDNLKNFVASFERWNEEQKQ
mgnify:FL=1